MNSDDAFILNGLSCKRYLELRVYKWFYGVLSRSIYFFVEQIRFDYVINKQDFFLI